MRLPLKLHKRLKIEAKLGNIEESKSVGTCSFLDPRFKTHVFTSEIEASLLLSLATYKYSLERRMNTATSTCNHKLKGRPTHIEEDDDEDDFNVSNFLDKKLEKAQPPCNYQVYIDLQ